MVLPEPDGECDRPPHMHNAKSVILKLIVPPSFARATRQAQELLSAALNKR